MCRSMGTVTFHRWLSEHARGRDNPGRAEGGGGLLQFMFPSACILGEASAATSFESVAGYEGAACMYKICAFRGARNRNNEET